MKEWDRNGPFSSLDPALINAPMFFEWSALAEHCIFIGQEDDVCVQLFNQTLPKGTPFVYKRDKSLDQPITFARDSNVLIFNGGLDFQTPQEFGELFAKKIKGIDPKNVLTVTFPHGIHCTGEALKFKDPMPCKDSLIQQFTKHSGDATKIDQSCLATVPKLRFATSLNVTRP
ncbi:hypothetical protein PINS_up002806 [Pythium insidiosum]|nr:hypothetical protein PINS_up002806 [Pythium insidiosum]